VEPAWLRALAAVWLISSAATFVVILYDLLAGHAQQMKVMSWVWPITALYFGPVALWSYMTIGRRAEKGAHPSTKTPFWETAFVATTHCGAGCTLGDVVAEWVIFLVGFQIAGMFLWSELIFDFVAAFVLGIVFQYFSIVPMQKLPPGKGVVAALRADALSLTAFEIGLFGWMLLMHFVIFRHLPLHPDRAVYWFMMQVGMLLGFATSYPVNWWLVRRGLKEAM
jgi:hypothetical protein